MQSTSTSIYSNNRCGNDATDMKTLYDLCKLYNVEVDFPISCVTCNLSKKHTISICEKVADNQTGLRLII